MQKMIPVLVMLMLGTPALANDDFAKSVLGAHNRERTAVGVPLLVWDENLAAEAAIWAKHVADTGRFEHAPYDARRGEGENLWEGTAGGFTPNEMVGAWAAEKTYFDGGTFKTGVTNDHVTGHYTQMVWRTTKAVGCALVTNHDVDVLVCRYSPAGNLVGEVPY